MFCNFKSDLQLFIFVLDIIQLSPTCSLRCLISLCNTPSSIQIFLTLLLLGGVWIAYLFVHADEILRLSGELFKTQDYKSSLFW